MQRAFKGIWIPKEIWLNEDLTLLEKVFLVEIDSLDNEEGCFASNDYFSKFFKLSKNRCSEVIKSLEKKGLISIAYIYKENTRAIDKRIIKVFDIPKIPTRKTEEGTREIEGGTRKVEEGYSENWEDNNTIINNTTNNTFNNTTTTRVVVDKIKSYFSLDEKDIKKIASAHLATDKDLSYLVEKLELTKSRNVNDVVAYLIAAIKNDYKASICNKVENKPKIHTRAHDLNQRTDKYTADQLEQIIEEKNKNKFDI